MGAISQEKKIGAINQEKYKRVERKASEKTSEDEIRISAKGRTSTYISYASKLLSEKTLDTFTLKATGAALTTAVTVAEVLKRRFKGLHQVATIGTIEVTDEWEPLEEGLEKVESKRNISFIEIQLSTKELDTKNKGYQEPLPEDQVVEVSAEELARGGKKADGEGGRRRGKGRGKGKGNGKKGKGKGKGKAEKKQSGD